MKKIIALNWKMNPDSLAKAKELFSVVDSQMSKVKDSSDVVICPPFVYLESLKAESSIPAGRQEKLKVKLGAQDLFWETSGAYTGEVSPKMLKNMGVGYVIVGHSERRKYMNETDEIINKKVLAALKAGLKVILCVGELKRESRIKNKELRIKKAKDYVKNQLQKDLKKIHNSLFKIHNSLIVAYEPVWAIGTGKNCNPSDAAEMAEFIKNFLMAYDLRLKSVPILYGGSVTGSNINQFFDKKEINGVLVGGASVDKKEVNKILKEL